MFDQRYRHAATRIEVAGRPGQPHQEPAPGRGRRSRPRRARCASTIPFTIARPRPAPAAAVAGRVGGARRDPRQATSKTRCEVLLGDAAAAVGDAELDAAVDRARRMDLDRRRPGCAGCAFISRLAITRDRPAGSATHLRGPARRGRRGGRPARRATGSAPAIASLTRSPSASGSGVMRQDAGVDPGELEEVVDHPRPSGRPRPGSGGGSARGRAPCRPRAPRSSRACPASGVRRSWETHETSSRRERLEPRLAGARLLEPGAGSAPAPPDSAWNSAGPRGCRGDGTARRPRVEPARDPAADAATSGDRRAPAATTSTRPRRRPAVTSVTTSRSCVGEEHPLRDGEDAGEHRSDGHDRHQRRAATGSSGAAAGQPAPSPSAPTARGGQRPRPAGSRPGRAHDAASQR